MRKNEVINFKMNWKAFWVIAISFLLCCALAFIRIAAENTIGKVSLQGYEVGQTALEDIYSPSDIEASDGSFISIKKGECIVKKGNPVTPEQYVTLKMIADSPLSTDFIGLGRSCLYLFLLSVCFYFIFSKPVMNRSVPMQELLFCAISHVSVYAVCSLCIGLGNFNPMSSMLLIMPTSLVVFLASIIFGNSTGLVIASILSLGVWEACGFKNILLGYVLGTSLMSARLVKNVRTRNSLVTVSLVQTAFNMILILLLQLVFGFGSQITKIADNPLFGFLGNVRSILSIPLFVGVNGFISGMLCLGLLTPLELMLNSTSPFRLKDLADMDNEIFHEMQKKAVGTYNHSLSVASMARSACDAIGANSQLAYVGAIYHDIGKLENPEYFTENQIGIENPHDNLDPIVSAGYLENHVSHGVEKAKEMGLPKSIVNIIGEHHGNSEKAYFMRKEMEANSKLPIVQQRTNEEIEEEFRYKARRSSSRESAVVHLADSVEAASVSNKDKLLTSDDRKKLIDNIVSSKIADHQLDDSGISYGDIEIIKLAFLKELNDKNYSRIKYQADGGQSVAKKVPEPSDSAKRNSKVSKTEPDKEDADAVKKTVRKSSKKEADADSTKTKAKRTSKKVTKVEE